MVASQHHVQHRRATAHYAMDEREFRLWAGRLAARTGVVVPPERKQFLETNLRLRMQELGLGAFSEYHRQYLKGRHGAVEWATLVDRLTVHETHFFRHMPSLRLVAERVLPEFRTRSAPGTGFNAWSVGCSTGEEAYSLGMIVDDFLREQGRRYHYGVTASDVSRPALATARLGRYPQARINEIPQPLRDRYTRSRGDVHFEMDAALRKRVAFVQLNLLDAGNQPLQNLDLIYCQNVLIYFPKEKREQIMLDLAASLGRGGYLVLGPGEMTGWSHPGLARVGGHRTLAFRRRVEEFEL